jgi:hypothetical protein
MSGHNFDLNASTNLILASTTTDVFKTKKHRQFCHSNEQSDVSLSFTLLYLLLFSLLARRISEYR